MHDTDGDLLPHREDNDLNGTIYSQMGSSFAIRYDLFIEEKYLNTLGLVG